MESSATASPDVRGRTGRLTVLDAAAVVVGVVIGAGIFKTPSLVAARMDHPQAALAIWACGGLISLLGALCYAELASAYPDEGGEYHFLRRAFGALPSFLFVWARLTVIQTGSIAMLGFLVGDYASQIIRLGEHSSALYAGLTVAALTGLNILGVRQGGLAQRTLLVGTLGGLAAVAVAGLSLGQLSGPPGAWAGSGATMPDAGGVGTAMVFVLLTYGGWNEAAYLSADLRDPGRDTAKTLLLSIGVITVAYLVVNAILLRALGMTGVAASEAAATDVMRLALGETGARVVSLVVVLTALSTMNGSMITGARSAYALGRDASALAWLGDWRGLGRGPTHALLAQGGVALALVGMGAASPGGFELMVEYTAPVFWLFFLLTTLTIFVLRRREPRRPRPFRTPGYPLTPLLFAGVCAWMLWSSLAYAGWSALVGAAALGLGLPVWLLFGTRSGENARGGSPARRSAPPHI